MTTTYKVTVTKTMAFKIEAENQSRAELLALRDASDNQPPDIIEDLQVTDVVKW